MKGSLVTCSNQCSRFVAKADLNHALSTALLQTYVRSYLATRPVELAQLLRPGGAGWSGGHWHLAQWLRVRLAGTHPEPDEGPGLTWRQLDPTTGRGRGTGNS